MDISANFTNIWKTFSLITIVFSLLACGGGGGGSNDMQGADQQELLNQINRQFPFVANQPIDVVYACQRLNSNLIYTFDFQTNGNFDLYSTLDNGQSLMVSGVYSYQNDELHLQSQNNFLSLDERSTNIESQFGLLYRFQTNQMDCIAIGHGYNNPSREFASTVHYSCPITNILSVSDDSNAIEFSHQNVPFNLTVPGSSFRQRDRNINGATQPNILRGYGIYRRTGDDFYMYFNNQFDDYSVLTGTFRNGDLAISVDQLEPSAGDCNLN